MRHKDSTEIVTDKITGIKKRWGSAFPHLFDIIQFVSYNTYCKLIYRPIIIYLIIIPPIG